MAPELKDLPFTPAALSQAEEYAHQAELYTGLEPAGAKGVYTVAQVEEVESHRRRPTAAEPATMDYVEGSELDPVSAGTWNGQPNFGCPFCDLKSLDEDRVREHIRRLHRASTTGPTGP